MLRKRKHAAQLIDHILLVVLLFLMVYPLFMAVWCSFKSTAEFNISKWYPTLPLNFENVAFAVNELWIYILNTVFVGGVGTLGVIVVSSLAAFAFARIKFFLKNFLYGMVIALMMIPAIMTLVPSFMLYKQLVGTDTYLILIIPIITGGSVFGVFLLRGFFEGISESIFEAAKIDGCGPYKRIWYITFPSLLPIVSFSLILSIGGLLGSDFEQILMFYNYSVYEVADVLSTWVYRVGLSSVRNYSVGIAVGLLNGIVGLVLTVSANYTAKKVSGRGMW